MPASTDGQTPANGKNTPPTTSKEIKKAQADLAKAEKELAAIQSQSDYQAAAKFDAAIAECSTRTPESAKTECQKQLEKNGIDGVSPKKIKAAKDKAAKAEAKVKTLQANLSKLQGNTESSENSPAPPGIDTSAQEQEITQRLKNQSTQFNASQNNSRRDSPGGYVRKDEKTSSLDEVQNYINQLGVQQPVDLGNDAALAQLGISRSNNEDVYGQVTPEYTLPYYYDKNEDGSINEESKNARKPGSESQGLVLYADSNGDILFAGIESNDRQSSQSGDRILQERLRFIQDPSTNIETLSIPWDNRLGGAYTNTQSVGNYMPLGQTWVGSPSLMNNHALIRFNHIANSKHHTNILDKPGSNAFRSDLKINYAKFTDVAGDLSAESTAGNSNQVTVSPGGDRRTKVATLQDKGDEGIRNRFNIPNSVASYNGESVVQTTSIALYKDDSGALYYEELDTSVFRFEPSRNGDRIYWRKINESDSKATGNTVFYPDPQTVGPKAKGDSPTSIEIPANILQEIYGNTNVTNLDVYYWAYNQGLIPDDPSRLPGGSSASKRIQALNSSASAAAGESSAAETTRIEGELKALREKYLQEKQAAGGDKTKEREIEDRYNGPQGSITKKNAELTASKKKASNVASGNTPPSSSGKQQVVTNAVEGSGMSWKYLDPAKNEVTPEDYPVAANGINQLLAQALAEASRDWKLAVPPNPIIKKYLVDPKEPTVPVVDMEPTMKNLVEMSTTTGREQFPYSETDFLYCKFYEIIPNNRLVTLRRFPVPVFDNGKTYDQDSSRQHLHPIAQAVTFFGDGTDNDLSSILDFTASLKWRSVASEVNEVQGNEQGADDGPFGKFSKVLGVITGEANFGTISGWDKQRAKFDPYKDGMYANRIYGPVNVIAETMARDRGLEFKHDINLSFTYSAKSFGGVNPKAAMLDILANILALTYNNANFWGGANRYFPNVPQYPFAGGKRGMDAWYRGDVTGFIDALGDQMLTALDSLRNVLESLFADPLGALKSLAGQGSKLWMATKQSQKRPEILKFKALLTGEPIGEWHLVIGNPFNPIAVIGNLVCTGVTFKFGEELGVDDFPTEMSVVITLAHARPRDKGDIESMFNRGNGRLHYSYFGKSTEAWNSASSTTDSHIDTSWQRGGGGNTNQRPEDYDTGHPARQLNERPETRNRAASTKDTRGNYYTTTYQPNILDTSVYQTRRLFGGLNKLGVDLAEKVGFRSGG